MRAATRGSEICSRGCWITRAHRSRSYGRRRSTRLLHSPITSASTTRSRQERSRRLQQQPSRTSTTNVRSCCARSSRRKPCGNRLSFVLRRERERKQVEPAFAQPARLYITSICSEQSGGSHVTRVGGARSAAAADIVGARRELRSTVVPIFAPAISDIQVVLFLIAIPERNLLAQYLSSRKKEHAKRCVLERTSCPPNQRTNAISREWRNRR